MGFVWFWPEILGKHYFFNRQESCLLMGGKRFENKHALKRRQREKNSIKNVAMEFNGMRSKFSHLKWQKNYCNANKTSKMKSYPPILSICCCR